MPSLPSPCDNLHPLPWLKEKAKAKAKKGKKKKEREKKKDLRTNDEDQCIYVVISQISAQPSISWFIFCFLFS